MAYSIRNLLISFVVVIIVVLLIVFRTFSALRSQEQEQEKIRLSRDALQKLGPTFIHLKEFESVALNYINTGDTKLLDPYNAAAQKLKGDSLIIAALAQSQPNNHNQYLQLAAIIHRITDLIPDRMRADSLSTVPGYSLPGVDSFMTIAGRLEDESRQTLNTSYNRSVTLARDTFVFVRIIAGLMIMILLISFWIIYKDIRFTRQTSERLQQFNRELEIQVNEKIRTIRVAEEKYRRLHESLSDAYAMVDMQGRLLEFNKSFIEMLGYSEDELLAKSYSDLTPGKWHDMEANIIRQQVLQNHYSEVYEKEYLHKNGEVFPVELRTFLLRNDSRQPEAMWAIVRDISDRKEAERKLETSEKHLRYVLSSTADNFYVLDTGHRVTLINEAAKSNLEKAWGKPVDLGTDILSVIPASGDEPIRESLSRVFKGELVEYELFHNRDDLPAWVLVTYTPVVDGEGVIIGAYIHAKDITEQKKAVLELVEAEAKFRNLVEQSLVGVYIILDGKLAYLNPQFAQIFGYPQHEMMSEMSMTAIVHPADHVKLLENIRIRVSGEKESLHYELRGIKKNGDEIDLEVFGSRTQFGGKVAIIGTLLDITIRKRTEDEKEHVRYLLNERVKELTTLYRISQVFQSEKGINSDLLREIVSILPSGLQFPEKAAARILLGNMEIKTANFGNAVHKQSAHFIAPGGDPGLIEVIYLDRVMSGKEDPFVEEERSMLNLVSEMLGIFLARRHESEMNKRMEEEMLKQKIQEQKTVIRAIFIGEERERNKIGRELHDNVNQILASVKLYLSMMDGKDEAYVRDLLKRSIPLIDDAIREIRDMSRSQVTPVKKINLEELIQLLIDKLNETTPLLTVFEYNVKNKGIGDDLKLNIYRIVQEQINNILKYAAAKNIHISIIDDEAFLHISIRDDGKGFDPGKKRKGIGISNMITRVESFNGEISITSSAGNGCSIIIRIPC